MCKFRPGVRVSHGEHREVYTGGGVVAVDERRREIRSSTHGGWAWHSLSSAIYCSTLYLINARQNHAFCCLGFKAGGSVV